MNGKPTATKGDFGKGAMMDKDYKKEVQKEIKYPQMKDKAFEGFKEKFIRWFWDKDCDANCEVRKEQWFGYERGKCNECLKEKLYKQLHTKTQQLTEAESKADKFKKMLCWYLNHDDLKHAEICYDRAMKIKTTNKQGE